MRIDPMSTLTLFTILAAFTNAPSQPSSDVAGPPASLVTNLAFIGAGRELLSTTTDGHLRIHSLPDGAVTTSIRVHSGAIRDLAVSVNEARVATAGADGRIRIVDLKTHKPLVDVAHDVVAVGFSADDRTLRAVTAKGHLLALDPETGAVRERKPCPDPRPVTGAWIFHDLVVQSYADG